MTDEKTFSLIGPGRLGKNLLYNLENNGWKCNLIISRNPSAHGDLESKYKVLNTITPADDPGRSIFLSVNDDSISNVALMLADSGMDLSGKRCLHFSGVLTSNVLDPLRRKGAAVGSLHPLYCFPRSPEELPPGILFSYEGDTVCYEIAKIIANDLNGIIYLIDKTNKTLYHTAASIAGNMSLALLYSAFRLISAALGDNREGQKESLILLVRSALNNLEKSDWKEALTGPVSRGDVETVKKHLGVLKEYGERDYEDLYNILKDITDKMLRDSDR